MKTVTVIGDGGWGTALALVLHRNNNAVRVWGPFSQYIEQVQRERENKTFLPGIPIPEDMTWTADIEQAVQGIDAAVIAIPSRYYRDVLTRFKPYLPDNIPLISVTKGLDKTSHHRMTETAQELLPHHPVVALSGPSHAEEVARGVPTAVVAACTDHPIAEYVQTLFNQPVFRVYTSTDIIGVELGGALKNVIAIAAGISDGIGFGDNTKAALITRGLAEMTRLGVALGAQPDTFSGLSGMGDLVVTCASKLSRNRSVGERLGRGERVGLCSI